MTNPQPDLNADSRGILYNAGMAAALPWAAVIVLRYLWVMRVPPPEGPGLLSFFASLRLPFSWSNGDFPALPFIGAIFALWLFTLIGRLFLSSFELYLPPNARRFLAFFCGIAIVGITLEPLAIFHVLYGPAVWAILIILALLLWRISYLAQRRPHVSSSQEGDSRVLRRAMAREALDRYRNSLVLPRGTCGKAFMWLAKALIGLITLLTFHHSLLYPVAYWDSLILYAGYARMTFLEHGFPVKVVAQVGIGLGANYPHLYSLLGSSIATMFGHWSTIYQQLIVPVAGLATTVLIYHTVLRMTRRVNHALAAALVYRAIPYGIAYNIYTSDYAIVILLAAAFCYVACLYIESNMPGYLAVLTLITATGAHVNYLMNAMWGLWVLTIIVAHIRPRIIPNAHLPSDMPPPDDTFSIATDPAFTRLEPRMSLRQLLKSRRFWTIALIGIALTLPWHIRNWIVTGNPVYAFFPEIFGGRNINPEVLQSAFQEWRANGEGIGVIAMQRFAENTLITRLASTWFYFVLWQDPWKLSPLFVAFGLPGFLFWLFRFVRQLIAGNLDETTRFGAVVAALLLGMLAYFYLLADFYLYQILAILPAIALFVGFWPLGTAPHAVRAGFNTLVFLCSLVPGLAMAMMGPKLPDPTLHALRNPLPAEADFYLAKFRQEYQAIQLINERLMNQKLLTHDNRHLLYDPSITLVHLDDWEIQKLYDVGSPEDRADQLLQMGIEYYYRIPMESRHPVNARLGMPELLEAGRMKPLYSTQNDSGESVILFRITKRGE